jgi:hypothetical protein
MFTIAAVVVFRYWYQYWLRVGPSRFKFILWLSDFRPRGHVRRSVKSPKHGLPEIVSLLVRRWKSGADLFLFLLGDVKYMEFIHNLISLLHRTFRSNV